MDSTKFQSRVFLQGRELDSKALRFAIDYHIKRGWLDDRHVSECIELAGGIAEEKSRARRQNSVQGPALFADTLNSLELANAIGPWVEKVRKDLFGSEQAPFKSYQGAIKWLESERNSVPELSEKKRKEQIEKYRQIVTEISEKIAQLPRDFSREFRLPSQTFFVPYVKAGEVEIIPAVTEKLRRLHDETKEMEKATGFDQRQLVAFILADLHPRLPVVRVTMPLWGFSRAYNLPTGGSIVRSVAHLECLSPSELKLAHLKRFYNQIREKFQIVKKKTLTNEDHQLLSLIGQHGPPPSHGQLDYWRKLAKEYNRKAKKRVEWNALRMRWNRLDKKRAALEVFKKPPKKTQKGRPAASKVYGFRQSK